METMRRKRKGSETTTPATPKTETETSTSTNHNEISRSTRRRPLSLSISLEACSRQRKKCKETAAPTSFKTRLAGIATAPPCGSSSANYSARGLKRKIGCIEVATKIGGRKKKIELDYILGEQIGMGKFGSVKLCKSRSNGAEFAVKTLRKGEETVHREVEIMQHLSGHPGVVTLKAVYEDSDCFHLVMELCSGGRLIDHIVKQHGQGGDGRSSENQAANIFKELMLVIKYCHEMGVVHRDIKPENILLTTLGKMKLADFGLATRIANGQSMSGVAGSPAYVAPEVLLGDYSEKVDIWSAGVLLHVLLVGTLPFQGDSLEAVFEAIKMVKLDFNSGIWEPVSTMARDLIGRMLTRNVSERITADEVLRHPWILYNMERTLKSVSVKSKVRNHVGASSCQLASRPVGESERRVTNVSLTNDSGPITSADSSSLKSSEEEDDCGLVDALAVAISRVRISEPKRSRICVPANPIQQECSSLKTSNLCTAF